MPLLATLMLLTPGVQEHLLKFGYDHVVLDEARLGRACRSRATPFFPLFTRSARARTRRAYR
jgi:hypothetical protein